MQNWPFINQVFDIPYQALPAAGFLMEALTTFLVVAAGFPGQTACACENSPPRLA